MFFPQPVAPLAPHKDLTMYVEGLDHPEGLAFDRSGLLWTGGEAGQIYRVENGRAQEIANLSGFCLGITVAPSQNIFVCNVGLHALQHIDRDGRVLQTIGEVNGQRLLTPNFSVFDRNGDLYFSDSGSWNGGNGCVYRLRRSGVVEWFAGPFFFANGLALNAKEDALFVVESQRDRIMRVEILADGNAGAQDVYASGLSRVPDGIAFDQAQNLYVTCYATDCIYRVKTDRSVELFAYDPEGTILARPTNCAFGGHDGKTMFVANLGRWHVTTLPVPEPGQLLAGQSAGGNA